MISDTIIQSEEIEYLLFRLRAVEYLTAQNENYSYESLIFIGPPHELHLKIYKNEESSSN